MTEAIESKSPYRWTGLTAVASAAAVILSGWNYYQTSQDKKDTNNLERYKADTSAKLQQVNSELARLQNEREYMIDKIGADIQKYQFVLSTLKDAVTAGQREQLILLSTVRLVTTDAEYQQLVSGFAVSSDSQVRALGDQARTEQDRIQSAEPGLVAALVDKTNSSDRPTRLGAVKQAIDQFGSNSLLVDEIITRFDEGKIDNITSDGRINAIYMLTSTTDEAWTPTQVEQAQLLIEKLRARSDAGVALIGPQTSRALIGLSERLNAIRAANRS